MSMSAYGDGELLSMARRGDTAARAELWDRADTDVEYGHGDYLVRLLAEHDIARPGAALASAPVAFEHDDRWSIAPMGNGFMADVSITVEI
ncbi:hypothetical protein SEA_THREERNGTARJAY_230 [Mycobacterium phage ThreeRngTarjay]|nr:hypothetical protein SEA_THREERNGTARJAY_230 [Mycobacterium phage ThreeRngTarjay]